MDQAVDGGYRHRRIREHVAPAGERLIGRDYMELSGFSTFVSSFLRR